MGPAASDRMDMSPTPEYDERFRLLYEAHGADLRAYCRRRLSPDEAEDATSETFAVAWRRLDSIPTGHDARLWLYGVAKNVVRNMNRTGNRRLRLVSKLGNSGEPMTSGPAEVAVTRSEHDEVIACLSQLKRGDQELLRLHAWEELSRQDIAEVLGISVPAVDMRLHRAIRRLAAALRSQEVEFLVSDRAEDRGGSS
jgi:RNA polymerase sigma-70 factor, ECF subfamily